MIRNLVRTMKVLHDMAFGVGVKASPHAKVIKVACGKVPPIGLDGKRPAEYTKPRTLLQASIEERIKASHCSCEYLSHSVDRATGWIGCELKHEQKAINSRKKRDNKWGKPNRDTIRRIATA